MSIHVSTSLSASLAFMGALLSFSNAHGVTAEKALATAIRTNVAPQLDGKLDEAVWAMAPETGGFTRILNNNPAAKHPTFVRSLYDGHKLYLGFRCIQPRATLVARATHDGAVWTDDCVELFITPHIATTLLQTRPPAEQFFHFGFNSAGTQFDELGTGGASSWDAPWRVKTTIGENEWQAELAIPFSSLYGVDQSPEPFTSWSIQIGRSVVYDPENTTIFPTFGLFRMRNGFGPFVFVTKAQSPNTIRWNLDRQNEAGPRLKSLRETIGQMKLANAPGMAAPIRAQANAIQHLTASFSGLAPDNYNKQAQTNFLDRLAHAERQNRDLQERLVIQKAASQKAIVAVAPHPAVVDSRLVKPNFLPAPDNIGKPVEVTVTPEQYQAASLVFWTKDAQRNVTVKLHDLRNADPKAKSGSLSSNFVDIRWVKVWYQSGSNDIVRESTVLTPELLLKNPDLVKVDFEAEKNITRITPGMPERGYPSDADTLQPLPLAAARTSTQVWFTIRVPKGTAPGRYAGTVKLYSGTRMLGQLPIHINVLDFSLAKSMLEHNWYTRSVWGIKTSGQTPQRALAEAQNLARHGVTSIGLLEHLETFKEAAAIMKKGGLSTEKIYIIGETGNARFEPGLDPAEAEKRAAAWVALAKASGAKEVNLYLEDEARGDTLRSMRPIAQAIRKAGAKTWVACYPDYFDIGGDFIDKPILSGGLVKQDLIGKIHKVGAKAFSYGNPQGGVEKPEIYRRNYGLLLWQNNYDGAFDFTYYSAFGPHIAEWNPWDDFLSPYWRQHCMVYPTQNGVVDTIQWEGWREGVTDCRYLATLLNEIAYASKNKRAANTTKKAQTYIASLKNGGAVALSDLDAVRSNLIRHIQAIRAAK